MLDKGDQSQIIKRMSCGWVKCKLMMLSRALEQNSHAMKELRLVVPTWNAGGVLMGVYFHFTR